MPGLFEKLRRRLYRVEETAIRVEQLQSEITNLQNNLKALNQTVAAGLQRLEEAGAQQRGAIAAVQAAARSAELLAGEGLTSVNELRLRGLDHLDSLRRMQARTMASALAERKDRDWKNNQFSVYSQFGEDGLIQLLLREIPIEDHTFIEFGVEDYREATTRFLLVNDRWRGLVLDGSSSNMSDLKSQRISQWYDLTSAAAFVTRDNINQIITDAGFAGPIGLLCVDIDGNDYWVWEKIDVVDPVIVIVEYNYRFGPELSLVVPYDPAFVKTEAHPSAIYYGASLSALCSLARRKGYAFVGCSEGGVNAFFVRRDRLPGTLPEKTPREGYVAGVHAEMRDASGLPVKASLQEQKEILLQLPLVTVDPVETDSTADDVHIQGEGTF